MTFVIGYATTASFVIIPTIVAAPTSVGYGLGEAASVTGLVLIPGGLVGAAMAVLTSRLERLLGSRAVMSTASVAELGSVGALLLAGVRPAMLFASSLLAGFGIGLGMTQAMNTVVASVPAERVASVGGLTYVLRSIGGTLGGQISGSILTVDLVPGTPFPTWSAFSTTLWIGSAVALVAVGASLVLPARAQLARLDS